MIELEKTLKRIRANIMTQREKLTEVGQDEKLRKRAAIRSFCGVRGRAWDCTHIRYARRPMSRDAALRLTSTLLSFLAIRKANRRAGYDIRVDMETKDKSITLPSKAEIIQDTGEVCSS